MSGPVFEDITVSMGHRSSVLAHVQYRDQDAGGQPGHGSLYSLFRCGNAGRQVRLCQRTRCVTGTFSIDILMFVHGGNTVVFSTSTLGVADQQFNVYVSPDGASLLLLF